MDNITIINGSLSFICENVSALEGFDVPTYRTVFIDPPERDGSLFINELAGARQFSWRGLIKDDIQANRRLLARICQPGGLKTVQFTTCDGIEAQIEATLSLVNPYSEERSPFLINAKAPNPYFVSQVLHSQTTGITRRRGGLPIPAAIPAPIGAGGGSPMVVFNAGNTYAQPIFEIQGPGDTFTIKNLDTGEIIVVDLTLGSSETVIIDTSTNDALQGNVSIYGHVTRTPAGQWIRLQPGNNRLSFTDVSGDSILTKLTVSWHDTWTGF